MSKREFIAAMHAAKREDPQSGKMRPDLDAEAIRFGYPNWHQAWHGLVMNSSLIDDLRNDPRDVAIFWSWIGFAILCSIGDFLINEAIAEVTDPFRRITRRVRHLLCP